MKVSPEKIIKMVESCTSEQLEELSKACKEKQKVAFSLQREMIRLSIDHELAKRKGEDTSKVGSIIIAKEG